ncbi:MAG: energy transducer TonB [Acidobacteriales bacterium]|nr:energy transducer TonB [Terriglobales bacterium]
MFEDSTFESTGKIKTRSRCWMVATLAMNGAILAALILMPLIYPDALPRHMLPTLLVAPEAPKQQPPPEPVRVRAATPHDYSEMMGPQLIAPRRIPIGIRDTRDREAPSANSIAMDLRPTGTSGSDPFGNGHPSTVVRSPVPTSIHLPSKLVEGNLIYKTIPQYPAIAKASDTEGTVVLQAMISKTGTIEGLHVISGSPMLQQAAIDAVRSWRYRPYMLNGQSVEVETTVNVIFKLQ